MSESKKREQQREKALAVLKSLMEHMKDVKAAPCSPEQKKWWLDTALPTLKDQALSELRRNDEFKPRLIGFMEGGTMGIIDVAKATGGAFGDSRSKDATAKVHQTSAMIPGTKASVFCTEVWMVHSDSPIDRKKYPNYGDHPDREEAMQFNMLHYDWDTNTMMQLLTSVMVVKVLGVNRSPAVWRDTKYGREITLDPHNPEEGHRQIGRFIFGSSAYENDK